MVAVGSQFAVLALVLVPKKFVAMVLTTCLAHEAGPCMPRGRACNKSNAGFDLAPSQWTSPWSWYLPWPGHGVAVIVTVTSVLTVFVVAHATTGSCYELSLHVLDIVMLDVSVMVLMTTTVSLRGVLIISGIHINAVL